MSSSLLFRTSIIQTLVSLVFLVPNVHSLFFNFTHFVATPNITFANDSNPEPSAMQLTKSTIGSNTDWSVGRVSYSNPVRLWDKNTNRITNFTTHFSFNITPQENSVGHADGFAFFLEPFQSSTAYAPTNSAGGSLGLLPRTYTSCDDNNRYPFVAIEFDTFTNDWDPSNDHVGIDTCFLDSKALFTVSGGLKNRSTAQAWITYDSLRKNLSVYLTYDANPVFSGQSNLSYIIDLSSVLPESVRVGFSAATGVYSELHSIFSWDFNSTLSDDFNSTLSDRKSKSKTAVILIGSLVAAISVVTTVLGSLVYLWSRKTSATRGVNILSDMDDDFDQETGPRRFTYNELSCATNNFSEEGKLGQGGFGGVYKGFLTDFGKEIAVKKI